MVTGKLGRIQRLTAEEWKERWRLISCPWNYEDDNGNLTYCGDGDTLFVGPGYPLKAIAPLLDVEDMEGANALLDGWQLRGIDDRWKDNIATWIKGRLEDVWTQAGRRQAAEWIIAHDYDRRDLDSNPIPDSYFLNGLRYLRGNDAVYLAGYLDGRQDEERSKATMVYPLTICWRHCGRPRQDLACRTADEAEEAAALIRKTWEGVSSVIVEEPTEDIDGYEIIDGSGMPVEESDLDKYQPQADLEESKIDKAVYEFFFWAGQYRQTGSKADLLAVGQYYGMICAYFDGDVPGEVGTVMDELVSETKSENTQAARLTDAMRQASVSEKDLAACLGLTVDGLRKKAQRLDEFTVDEIRTIARRLHLNAAGIDRIFFEA